MDALHALQTMSTQAPGSEQVREGQRDILLGQQSCRKPPDQILALRHKSSELRLVESLALHTRWRLFKVTKIVRRKV
jgi:hypothetical protein